MSCNPQTVIQVAKSQIGYLEKKSNADLDSFTGNAGSNNYTKYNRDMKAWAGSANMNDQWCQNFVDWCFVKAYGLTAAKALLGGFTNYTPTGSNWFKKRGLYTNRGKGTPKAGDVIYFYSTAKGRIGHVGIVEKVTSTKVYTIEGNTSGASTLVTNGGGVRAKSYSLTSTYIDGYGRPPYASVNSGNDTPAVAPTPSTSYVLGDRVLKNGMDGNDVKEMQSALIRLGYDLGKWGADGEFGDCTELALRKFQSDEKIDVDGEFGPESLAALNEAIKRLNQPIQNAKNVKIFGGNCYVRTEPNTGGEKIGVVRSGEVFVYAGETSSNGWLKISYKGRELWVSGKYGQIIE